MIAPAQRSSAAFMVATLILSVNCVDCLRVGSVHHHNSTHHNPYIEYSEKQMHLLEASMLVGEDNHSEVIVAHNDTFPIPEVVHHKVEGGDYTEDSPLYELQQARKVLWEVAPVSASMTCIIVLMAQFFFVYTVLFVMQVLNRLKVIAREAEEALVCRVAQTVFWVPMLCVAFLMVRLQAVELSHGQPEVHGLPPWWLKAAMIACTICVMLHTAFVCVFALTFYGCEPSATARVERHEAKLQDNNSLHVGRKAMVERAERLLRVWKGIATSCVYAAFSVVVVGILTMEGPAEYQGKTADASLYSTVFLILLYFGVHFVSIFSECTAVAADEDDSFRVERRSLLSTESIRYATTTVAIAPMLCVLFIAARVRTSEISGWASDAVVSGGDAVTVSYAICSGSLLLLTLLSFCSVEQRPSTLPNHVYSANEKMSGITALQIVRIVTTACLYVGLIRIGLDIVADYPALDEALDNSVPVPTTMKCIFTLAVVYFTVHLALWLITSIDESRPLHKQGDFLSDFKGFLGARVKEAVSFCPMICILFLGTLVRARQLSHGDSSASPQSWCMKVQVLATGAIIVLAISRFDGVLPPRLHFLANACMMMQYVCLSVLYGSAIAVVIALFLMQPDNLYHD